MDQDKEELLEQLRQDFESDKNADLEVHVQDKKFNVSKYILCVRSPVFAAMFNSDTKENQTNVIKVEGFDAELVEKFLLYLYIGTVEDLDSIASEMYSIANYYDVKRLRKTCLENILNNLNHGNAIDRFKFATKFNLDDLNKSVVNFIIKNLDQSTAFKYHEFAKKYLINELEVKIVDYVCGNLATFSLTEEWKKFDSEFRLQIFQEFFEQGPILKVKQTSDTAKVSLKFIIRHNVAYDIKHYSLKNVGKNRLAFKIAITEEESNFTCSIIDPKKGFIEPNNSVSLFVNFKCSNSFIALVNYETTTKTDINECFGQNALVRHFKIDSRETYE